MTVINIMPAVSPPEATSASTLDNIFANDDVISCVSPPQAPTIVGDGNTVGSSAVIPSVFFHVGQPVVLPCGGKVPQAGSAILLASTTHPNQLAIDASRVYWTTSDNKIMTALLGGGGLQTLATGLASPWSITASNSTNLYISDNTGVLTMTKTGGPVTTFQAWAKTWGVPNKVLADSSNVYWSDSIYVSTLPIAGGVVKTVGVSNVPPDSDFIVSLAVSTTHLYWTDDTYHMVARAEFGAATPPDGFGNPTNGGPLTFTILGQSAPSGIVADLSYIYWIDVGHGTVNRASLSGTGAVVLATVATSIGPYIAIDETNVYWTDPTVGTVSTVAKVGSTTTVLVTGQTSPRAIAADCDNVYWTNNAAIMRLPKTVP